MGFDTYPVMAMFGGLAVRHLLGIKSRNLGEPVFESVAVYRFIKCHISIRSYGCHDMGLRPAAIMDVRARGGLGHGLKTLVVRDHTGAKTGSGTR